GHVPGGPRPQRDLRLLRLAQALMPLLRQRRDESLGTGVKNLGARTEIAEKRDEPRILAAAIIGEDFEYFARIRQAPALRRTQKHARDPVGEIAADDQQVIVFKLVKEVLGAPAL